MAKVFEGTDAWTIRRILSQCMYREAAVTGGYRRKEVTMEGGENGCRIFGSGIGIGMYL